MPHPRPSSNHHRVDLPVLPGLLVLALTLGPTLGSRGRGALALIAPAQAQSRIEELKGALGAGCAR